jgi:hypothetical protein
MEPSCACSSKQQQQQQQQQRAYKQRRQHAIRGLSLVPTAEIHKHAHMLNHNIAGVHVQYDVTVETSTSTMHSACVVPTLQTAALACLPWRVLLLLLFCCCCCCCCCCAAHLALEVAVHCTHHLPSVLVLKRGLRQSKDSRRHSTLWERCS